MLEVLLREIIINVLKFLLHFIILKHLKYHSKIQNINHNFFKKNSFRFYNFKTLNYLKYPKHKS